MKKDKCILKLLNFDLLKNLVPCFVIQRSYIPLLVSKEDAIDYIVICTD